MCGIAGVLAFDGRPVQPDDVVRVTDALAHRGRDSADVVCGGTTTSRSLSTFPGIGLGHRRLSVIDLSPSSAQPMVATGGGLWITYNGELYNYETLREELRQHGATFRTESDTEVVLEAYRRWGTDALRRFNGMFAFAIWDDRTQELICARDPLGIKPLYFTADSAGLRFASEARALVGGTRAALSPDAVTAYFASMYVPGHLSMFAGVQKLPAGHIMRVSRTGQIVTSSYWDVPEGRPISVSAEEAAERLLHLLDAAVARQLRSDVPVGALLSGGFDSGMVVASAARTATRLHTYSVGFDDDRQLNELPVARSLAERYGTQHHERLIRSNEVINLLDLAIGSLSEPAADSAIVPTYCLSQMAGEDGVKVLLSGTGGDEVFAGYTRYVGYNGWRRLLLGMPDGIRSLVGRVLPGHPALAARLRHRSIDMMMNTGGSGRLAGIVNTDPGGLGAYLDRLSETILPRMSPQHDSLYRHMTFDLKVYLPDLLLMLLDQLTMAHTIEGRVPLIDVDLVTASFELPASMHATADQTKLLMRRMAVGRVDPQTLTARKQGFSGPVWRWIADNREVFRERTMAVREVPGCQGVPVDALWASSDAAASPRWPTEVFLLFVLSTWYHGPRHA